MKKEGRSGPPEPGMRREVKTKADCWVCRLSQPGTTPVLNTTRPKHGVVQPRVEFRPERSCCFSESDTGCQARSWADHQTQQVDLK